MPDIIRIDDPGDPRLADYRHIRERDLVGREGRFIAEGRVVLNVLLGASRFQAESLLLLENRLDGASDLLERAADRLPVYVASQPVLDAIAGFHVHRGILGIGRRTDEPSLDGFLAELPPRALVLVLVGISNHDNVGAIFRNASAFEADAILLDETSCDPLYRKAIRVSVGGALKVPYWRGGSVDAILASLGDRGFDCLALSPAGATDIAAFQAGERTALLLGSEGTGLPPELLGPLSTIRIAMSKGFDSLNVATAAAIALHRLWAGALVRE
ncbi:RNA methyltransferase [Aquibium carbonis]|uniref:RNA methyltransferase n=1 Tax=Aquibium carbonis TaxID=2495581 RepID=A0A3S0ASI5_9HYPH|nr:RNA methyltransferase [Aquibium carbonis]RST86083.1 RNA methyltransferase [Aquibium carbonis]